MKAGWKFGMSWEDEKKRQVSINARTDRFVERLQAVDWPCAVGLSLSNCGPTLIQSWVYIEPGATAEQIHQVIAECVHLVGPMSRNFREKDGSFYWTPKHSLADNAKDEGGGYCAWLAIEGTDAALNCTLRKVTKTVEVYEADCTGA